MDVVLETIRETEGEGAATSRGTSVAVGFSATGVKQGLDDSILSRRVRDRRDRKLE